MLRKFLTGFALFALTAGPVLSFVGCESDGPLENTVEDVEEAGEEATD